LIPIFENPGLFLWTLLPFCIVLLVVYLGWRFVRALERRKGTSVQVLQLVEEVRALRTQVSLLSSEVAEFDSLAGETPRGSDHKVSDSRTAG
jgi:hypothetical protein